MVLRDGTQALNLSQQPYNCEPQDTIITCLKISQQRSMDDNLET
jgi:hypothetical protein